MLALLCASLLDNMLCSQSGEMTWVTEQRSDWRTANSVQIVSGPNNKLTSPFSLYCSCNSSAITWWRQNMLTLYILGSDTERKIFCGFFFPKSILMHVAVARWRFYHFHVLFQTWGHRVVFLPFLWSPLVGRCVFTSHATCCSFWIGVLDGHSGVQWAGLTHISQMFPPHTIYSKMVLLRFKLTVSREVTSAEQRGELWLLPFLCTWMAPDLMRFQVCKRLTEFQARSV